MESQREQIFQVRVSGGAEAEDLQLVCVCVRVFFLEVLKHVFWIVFSCVLVSNFDFFSGVSGLVLPFAWFLENRTQSLTSSKP